MDKTTLVVKVRILNFAYIFLTLSFIYGNDSNLHKTTSVTSQTYLKKRKNLFFFFNFLFKDLFKLFICLL